MAHTKAKLKDMDRVDLRKLAIPLGFERTASAFASDEDLIDFILKEQGGGDSDEDAPKESKKRGSRKPAPPDDDDGDGDDDKPDPPEEDKEKEKPKRQRRASSKKEEKKEKPEPAAPAGDLSDLINRIDVIGGAVEDLVGAIDDIRKVVERSDKKANAIKHLDERLQDVEAQVTDIHKGVFWTTLSTFGGVKTYDELDEVPEGED
jgi:hypothetical protein